MSSLHDLAVENDRLRRLVATLEAERLRQQERTRCVEDVLDQLDSLRDYVALLERGTIGLPSPVGDTLDLSRPGKAEEALRYLSHRLLVALREILQLIAEGHCTKGVRYSIRARRIPPDR
jgi:hypothetical protein